MAASSLQGGHWAHLDHPRPPPHLQVLNHTKTHRPREVTQPRILRPMTWTSLGSRHSDNHGNRTPGQAAGGTRAHTCIPRSSTDCTRQALVSCPRDGQRGGSGQPDLQWPRAPRGNDQGGRSCSSSRRSGRARTERPQACAPSQLEARAGGRLRCHRGPEPAEVIPRPGSEDNFQNTWPGVTMKLRDSRP